jgi:hypothetical protein
MKKMVLFVFVSYLFLACNNNKVENVERAFYYWKTNNYDRTAESVLLDTLKINKLYVKFFEVEPNEIMGNIPVAKSNFDVYEEKKYQIIPCVYIRNEVFLKSNPKQIDDLADNINFLINKKLKNNFEQQKTTEEFQMDCDWTIKSKENYFYFLKKLKAISNKKISCTLRLYPYKYPDKMGIPPVDKATLMCYNLISPFEDKSKNSILDTDELEKYLDIPGLYPLHLDIGLPVYSWMQVYQNNHFSRVIYTDFETVKSSTKPINPLWYEVTKDTIADEVYLRIGDKIKYDEITKVEINTAIKILKKHIEFDKTTTISLFHLGSEQLKTYTYEDLTRFYTSFSN